MKTIVIMNLKGGVGKTITAVNLAAILASKGKRVLLVDADHQGNTSAFFQSDQMSTTLSEILRGENEPYWADNVQRTGYEGLDIVPGSMALAELETSDALYDRWHALYRLREFLLSAAEDDAYDFAVIDMPPAFSTAAKAALIAADEVIVPMKLDAFSVNGMAELLRQIASMRTVNPRLRLAGILITMWRNMDMTREAEKILRSGSVPVYKTVIRRTDIVDESTYGNTPLYLYSPNCAASVDYKRFAAEYLEGSERRA